LSNTLGGVKKLREERAKEEVKRSEEASKDMKKFYSAENFLDQVTQTPQTFLRQYISSLFAPSAESSFLFLIFLWSLGASS
jgi:hypothetical protein